MPGAILNDGESVSVTLGEAVMVPGETRASNGAADRSIQQGRIARINPFDVLLEAARARSLQRMADKARGNAQLNPPSTERSSAEPPEWVTAFPDYSGDIPWVDEPEGVLGANLPGRVAPDGEDTSPSKTSREFDAPGGRRALADRAMPGLMLAVGYYGLDADGVASLKRQLGEASGAELAALADAYGYIAQDIEFILNRGQVLARVLDTVPALRGAYVKAAGDDEDDARGVVVRVLRGTQAEAVAPQ